MSIKILLSDLTIFGAENRAEMTILGADLVRVRKRMIFNQFRLCRNDYSRRRLGRKMIIFEVFRT